MSTAKCIKVEVQKCSNCKGAGRFPDGTYSSYDCTNCKGTGKVEVACMEDGTIRAPLTQFMDRGNTDSQPGQTPTSREILTEIMEDLITVTADVTWLNFENDVPGVESVEQKLWGLRGMLGDYVRALREEGKA